MPHKQSVTVLLMLVQNPAHNLTAFLSSGAAECKELLSRRAR